MRHCGESHSGRGWRGRWFACFVLVAAVVRTAGISHDTHLNERYHPDASKQIVAVVQFRDGDYLNIKNHPDYDGYPLFASLVVGRVARGYGLVRHALLDHLGITDLARAPEESRLEIVWAFVFWNVLLSSLAVGLTFLIGLRFGRAAGILSGVMMLLSPLDQAACHWTTSDTSSAFFVTLGLYLSLRVYETGRYRDYVLAALATVAAFSSKYHGGIVGASFLLAHLLRSNPRAAEFWRKLGVAAVVGVAGLVCFNPGILVNPGRTIRDIVHFLRWTANYRLDPEVANLDPARRFLAGMRMNLPFLPRFFGWGAIVAAVTAVWIRRRSRPFWIVATIPLLLVIVGMTLKPFTHSLHHLPMTAGMIAAAAAGFAGLHALVSRWGRPVAALLAMLSLAQMSAGIRDEIFFSRHNDNQLLGRVWLQDNFPPGQNEKPERVPATGRRSARYVSIRDTKQYGPASLLPGVFELVDLRLERSPLAHFRNRGFVAVAPDSDELRRGFSVPLSRPVPSAESVDWVFLDAPFFFRTPSVRDLGPGGSMRATAVSRHPLGSAWVAVWAGGSPAAVDLSFGNRRRLVSLSAGERVVIELEDVAASRPASEGNHFYEWRVEALRGSIRVQLLGERQDVGRRLFAWGRYGEAYRFLSEPGGADDPARRLALAVCGVATGRLDAAGARKAAADFLAVKQWDSDSFFGLFGVRPEFLAGLPFMEWRGGDLEGEPGGNDTPAGTRRRMLRTPPAVFDAGWYRLEIGLAGDPGELEVVLDDSCGRRRFSAAATVDPARPRAVSVPLWIGHDLVGGTIGLAGDALPAGGEGLRVSLVPDALADVAATVAFLDRVSGAPDQPSEPFHPVWYETLLALGESACSRGGEPAAREWFRRAASADPARTAAASLAAGNRDGHPGWRQIGVVAEFESGPRLTGCLVGADPPHPGVRWPFRMTWEIPPERLNLKLPWVWVHLFDDAGKRALMTGYPLRLDLAVPPADDRRETCVEGIDIPPDLPPGRYRIKAGLYVPTQERDVDLRQASVPHGREDLDLGFVNVGAPPTR